MFWKNDLVINKSRIRMLDMVLFLVYTMSYRNEKRICGNMNMMQGRIRSWEIMS